MEITKADVEAAKNWTKLITHPVNREIENRIVAKIEKTWGDGAIVIFSHFTEIEFKYDQIIDQDSSFDWNDVDEEGDIPILVYKNCMLTSTYVSLNELLDI